MAERPVPGPRLHHIGFVAADGGRTVEVMAGLGLKAVGSGRVDPVQKVRATFVDLTGEEEIFLEILEPTAEDSPVTRLADKGGGLHHLCFEVGDIEAVCRSMEEQGFRWLTGPVDCSGFDRSFPRSNPGRTRIAFWLLPVKLLIELVERPG